MGVTVGINIGPIVGAGVAVVVGVAVGVEVGMNVGLAVGVGPSSIHPARRTKNTTESNTARFIRTPPNQNQIVNKNVLPPLMASLYKGGQSKTGLIKVFNMKGKVKWFNTRKGFGFIEKEDGSDIFVHMNDIEEGVNLNEGDEVEFEPADSPKGPKATKVTKA